MPADDDDIDKEYLGAHIDPKFLDKYVKGQLNRSTMEKRESHVKVLDFSKLLDDWQTNNIHERSFVCLDPSFFDKEKNEVKVKVNKDEEEEKKESSDDGVSILDMIKHLKE
mmetsp:Transcript_8523/g.7871  ORF Transcript_8523/g.7871 Transcript_8523/m.7871 type:complete len:111 (+) Transcript_8523:579-911(+)|eukprot:CAMPEP_0170561036 /NCGR_PEP_ID=MMETSP0211-20121228/52381_1 /TAXON_ID=311385 /ORGANISM="Pseudokeronopsis sp., Strain OXSARD2" /LENGTH=110 /DNA_ID=CAMNT_0010876053 /DNA_START=316 /DNA_END=648 /DNA_ORIENTATION=-